MHARPLPPHQDDRERDWRDDLERQVRQLQERLAFYEGFDVLIQDNVAQARELFRLAAQEREAAAAGAERARREAREREEREERLRADLEAIAADVDGLARAVEALSRRIAATLGEPANGKVRDFPPPAEQRMAIVVHGVPSARTALSLQRYVGSLPQVSDVSAREFTGGMLRLDARVRDRLEAVHLAAWEDGRRIQLLTERPDVIELALEPA